MSTAVGGKTVGSRARGVLGVMAAALVLMTAVGAGAEDTYVIISSGTGFTAIKDDEAVGAANTAIQNVINAIKADAQGNACTIQFGVTRIESEPCDEYGENEDCLDNGGGSSGGLNIGSANIVFDGGAGGTDWGKITLAGRLVSSYNVYALENGTIYLTNGVSIESTAAIVTNGEGGRVVTIYNKSTGTVNLSGGTVSASAFEYDDEKGANWFTQCRADGGSYAFCAELREPYGVYNASTGTVTISGGNISTSTRGWRANSQRAYGVYNESGMVTISDGTISSSNHGVYNVSGTVTISGGTISVSYNSNGYGVSNESGTVTITGGMAGDVSNESGIVIISDGTAGGVSNESGTVTISGVTVGGLANKSGTMTITGCTVSGSVSNTVGTMTITDCIVSGSVGSTSAGKVIITGCTVSDSVSSTSGSMVTIRGGIIGNGVTVGSTGTLVLGGSPEIIGYVSTDLHSVGVITTGDSIFAPADNIYALKVTEYLIDEVAVVGGAEFLSNFILYNATENRLGVGGNDIVIKYALTATPYTVSFNGNGGSGTMPSSFSILSGSKLPYIPTAGFTGPTGKVSDGKWYTDAAGTTEFIFGTNGTAVTSNITLYLKWVENNSVLSSGRVIPNGNTGEVAVVAPVAALSGELAVGPNPVSKSSGSVVFFWNGKPIKSGALTVYDVSGNVVRKLAIKDNAVTGSVSKRAVGSWDLRDGKGRQVSEGTYLVKGKVVTFGGKGERVSVVVGVR